MTWLPDEEGQSQETSPGRPLEHALGKTQKKAHRRNSGGHWPHGSLPSGGLVCDVLSTEGAPLFPVDRREHCSSGKSRGSCGLPEVTQLVCSYLLWAVNLRPHSLATLLVRFG